MMGTDIEATANAAALGACAGGAIAGAALRLEGAVMRSSAQLGAARRSSAQLGATEAETQAFLADSTPAAAQRWPLRRRERLRQQREPPSSRVGQLCGAGEISSPELDQRPALRFMARFGPMR
jgi:tellurite resistance protein